MRRFNTEGFTIVELLVVIVVIGVLAAVTIISYVGVNQKAVVSALQSDLAVSSKTLKLYFTEYGSYPALDANSCPTAPSTVDSKYCLKYSGTNTRHAYNSTNQTFSLSIRNGSTIWSITNDSPPYEGTISTAPEQPVGFSAASGCKGGSPNYNVLNLGWSAPSSDGGSPVTGYKIYRSTTSGGESLLTSLGNVLSYQDGPVSKNVTYYYTITAVNSLGEGQPSAEITGVSTGNCYQAP